ncbi:ABC transporter substrate-binding protein [Candidatus Parabeggiatoa sp. HSG14]|uniref:ABC transporter substrate-binding protein n=1 Tax=Candidatus Parabeggiatoa sp. HSG14 TaxID=3055593 RepID=UPI0025A7FB25|nr:ABC transporter substrate-binding protein [Thiotrichales bacterium HSG14]
MMVKTQANRTKMFYGGLALIVFGAIIAFFLWGNFYKPLHIALVGPITTDGQKNPNGKAMQQGVQLAIDEINRQGGINGRRIKLKIFDDQNRPDIAKQVAQEIANGKYLAVIGHYTSSASLAAAKVYKASGIPAISGSATADELTQGNDWYFRVIFNNSDQGALLAYYVKKVLGYNKASVLFDSDAYGATLAKTFMQTASMIGLKVENQWCFVGKAGGKCPSQENRFNDAFKEKVNQALKPEKPDILFLATHSKEAVAIIKALRKKDNQVLIIGADALSSKEFYKRIKHDDSLENEDNLEKYQPGYYTDGIYLTTPFIADLAGKRAIDFKHSFLKKYGEKNPSPTSIIYYDAAQVILHALKNLPNEAASLKEERVRLYDAVQVILHTLKDLLNTTASLKEERMQLKESLWKISNHNQAVEGVTGPIYFDKNGDVDQSIPIGVFEKGKPTVALSQYRTKHLTKDQSQTDRMLSEVFEGNLIKANGKFRSRAEVVHVGVELNKITQLEMKESSYMIDFYIWFRTKIDDTIDIDNLELDINTTKFDDKIHFDVNQIEFVNIVKLKEGNLSKSKMADSEMANIDYSSVTDEKMLTKTYRVKAQFKGDFDFHRYPLDHQILSIQLRHKNKKRDTLIYAVDTQGLKIDSFVERVKEKGSHVLAVNGWLIHDISLFEDIQKADSTFGFPKYFNLRHQLEYSRLNIEVEIKRHVVSFFWKNLFPNMLLIILGYGIFFINSFGTQISLGINLILPTSILHIRTSAELPTLAYFTFLEYTFYLIYFLAVCSLLMIITMHIYEEIENKQKLIKDIRFAGRIGYPLVVFVGFALILYYF